MDALIGLVLGGSGELYMWVAGIAGAALALVGMYFKGASGAKKNAKIDDLDRAIDVKERADEARQNSDADNRTGDERLREHGKLRD